MVPMHGSLGLMLVYVVFLGALMSATSLGLEPNTLEGLAFLIPSPIRTMHDVPEEAPPEAKASVQAAMPSIATGAAASSAQSGALDKDLNTNFAYAPQQPKTSWSGSYSPVTVESQELITDAATFQTEWNKVQLGQPLPPVDLTTQAVVLLNAGEKPTTGYSIQLSRSEETANQLIIHYQVLVPAPGAITGQMVTHPWVLQAIPKPVKPVVFQKD